MGILERWRNYRIKKKAEYLLHQDAEKVYKEIREDINKRYNELLKRKIELLNGRT